MKRTGYVAAGVTALISRVLALLLARISPRCHRAG